MNRQLVWSLGLIGGAILIGALLVVLRPEPEQDAREQPIPLVQTVPLTAASGPIPVLGSGTVQPREEVNIAVQVQGRLTYVHPQFREGGVIARGATVLRIDESDYRNDVRQAQADVAAQNVAVLEAEEEVAIAREELARFATREEAMARMEAPSETQILPPEGISAAQEARAEAPTATPEEESEEETKVSLATREPQLRSAQASRERARAGLADARLLLGRTRIKAPFSGFVREENAAVGALVQVGQSLGSIVATDAYEVRIALTAEEAALIPGLLSSSRSRIPARITSSFGGKTYEWDAYVDRANAILDAATRNIDIFLRVPAPLTSGRLVAELEDDGTPMPAPPLLLGAFVEAEITGASLESYAAVPAIAVRPGNEIWIVRGGKLEILPVRVIQRSDKTAYIATPSLAEGGALVVSNLAAPIAGMQVRRAEAPSGEGAKEASSEEASSPETGRSE